MSGFVGSGDLYVDRLTDNGESTGFLLVGNAIKVELKPESDTKDRVSRKRDSYGQVLDSVSIPKPTKLSISIDELQKTNLAIALMGTLSETTALSGSVSPGSVGISNFTAGSFDVWNSLPHTHISNVTLMDKDAVVEYVISEGYSLNERLGLISVLSTGDITEAQELRIAYDYAVPAQSKIAGSTVSTVKARIKMDGINRVNGQSVILDIDEAILTPKSAVDFLSDTFLKLDLEGVCKTLSGKTSPYTVTLG